MASTKLYLDARASKADSPAPMKLSVNHLKSSLYISLNLSVMPSQWDKATSKVTGMPTKRKQELNGYLQRMKADADDVIRSLGAKVEGMSPKQLRDHIHSVLFPAPVQEAPAERKPRKPKENPNSVCRFFERYIEKKCKRESTASLYRCTWRRIVAWLGEKKASKLEFSDINYTWIEDFDSFLALKAPKENGRRPHLANLKAVINYAIDNEVIDRNPFRRFPIKTNNTEPRALTLDELKMIIFSKVEPWMEKYRDFFVLSFLMRGTNTVDLCLMAKPVEGRVKWKRRKTDIDFEVRIEPEAQMIINKYVGASHMLDICDGGRHYRRFADKCTKALHKMVKYINDNRKGGVEVPDFTMYWARHTWATIAYDIDIPFDLVDVGLAHSAKGMANIYIKRDPAKIDQANRRVLDYVLYGKDYRLPEPLVVPQAKKRGRPRKSA